VRERGDLLPFSGVTRIHSSIRGLRGIGDSKQILLTGEFDNNNQGESLLNLQNKNLGTQGHSRKGIRLLQIHINDSFGKGGGGGGT